MRRRAFERRLSNLLDDSEVRRAKANGESSLVSPHAKAEIAALDAAHPDGQDTDRRVRSPGNYQHRYRQKYDKALQESGVKPERVGFLHYLEADDDREDH